MHTIRLRGPWQLEPIDEFHFGADGHWTRVSMIGNRPPACRQTMPADWSESLGEEFCGCVRYRRSFQRPTNLEPGDWVWLVVDPPRSAATVHLGKRHLGNASCNEPAARFEINSLLEDRNELEIYVSHPLVDDQGVLVDDASRRLPGGLVGEVRLEITPAAEVSGNWTRD